MVHYQGYRESEKLAEDDHAAVAVGDDERAVGADGWGGPDWHAGVVVEDDAAGATVERVHMAAGAARIQRPVDVERGRVVDRARDGIAPLDGTVGAVEGVHTA